MINCVKRWRQFEGLTQVELAAACDCRRETITNIERGYYYPNIELAMKIAKVLNRPIEGLFALDDEEPPEFGWILPSIERQM